MSPEPENPMDACLKAYARQRGQQAQKMELPPATRRLLQAEVVRHYGQLAKRETQSGRRWLGALISWPRLGYALGLLLVVGVALTSLIQTQSPPTEIATPSLKSQPPDNPPAPEQPTAALARDSASQIPESPAAAPTTPPAQESRRVPSRLFFSRTSGPTTQPLRLLSRAASAQASGPAEITTQPAPHPARSLARPTSVALKQTSQVGSASAERAPAAAPAFLMRFELEETAAGVRIRDADGSVYEGRWVPAEKPAGLQAWPFRVSGTNLTANRKLSFVGALFKPTEPVSHRRASGDWGEASGIWHLRGTVQSDGTNAWEIVAAQDPDR